MAKNIVQIDAKKRLQKVNKSMLEMSNQMMTFLEIELFKFVQDARTRVIKSMRDTPKSGTSYKRGRKTHIASSEGNPPAIDTGNLISRIVGVVEGNTATIGVAKGAPYAEFLEPPIGNLNRPFLLDNVKDEFKKQDSNILKNIIDKIHLDGTT